MPAGIVGVWVNLVDALLYPQVGAREIKWIDGSE